MMNDKQLELSQGLFEHLKEHYPEIQLEDIVESGVYPNHIWVNLVMPETDDRRSGLREQAADLSTDILLDYGYHITVSSANGPVKQLA